MVSQDEVRSIALSLPATVENDDRFAFEVVVKDKRKGFTWVWYERVQLKKPRVANNGVLVVRVADLVDRQALLSAAPEKFFTEPHYNGYPAVLVRLAAIERAELAELITDAWRSLAPRSVVQEFDARA